ncbi:MAG TPA: class I SAM-dependent rRNA methyltransferase [Pyrinomonadaceae bacterium]|nr:class I SAM-dependent rRNA methyltransferase [Pyrinomonadaceae bacterium]
MKITTRGAKRIRNGHLWVYRSDVREPYEAEGGAIVRVVDDAASNFVGQAFYSDASEIALRFLTTREETIDRDWWRSRLQRCAQHRGRIARETNAYRLVYSEGDLLSSLIVDLYDNVMVMQNLSQGSERVQSDLVALLSEEFSPRAIVERNDARVRGLEGLESRTGVLYQRVTEPGTDRGPRAGSPRGVVDATGSYQSSRAYDPVATAPGSVTALDQIEINQHGVRFLVTPVGGQKTGAFLDQRENYLAARSVAHGRALDCFTFNGGFALHIASSCESVVAIDISDDAIAGARRNAELNEARNVEFRTANVFDVLREMESSGERFDTIVLDPPAFAKSKATVKSAVRGYKEINLRALKLLNPGGVLVTCTCSYHISEELFLEIIEDAALDAHRRLQIIEKRGQSSDHPVLLGVPETHYLKCVIARVIE